MIIPKSAFYEEEIDLEQEATESSYGAAYELAKNARHVAQAISVAGDAVKSVKGTIGKSSITRMGRESILEFPAIFSSSIDLDDGIAIAKMLERYYASLMVSIFSLRPAVALKEYNNISEYIKSIHSNNNIPSNFKKMDHFISKESLEDTSDIAEEGLFKGNDRAELSVKFGSLVRSDEGKQLPRPSTVYNLAAVRPMKDIIDSGVKSVLSSVGFEPKGYKPDLISATKYTADALEKAKKGYFNLVKAKKSTDKRYVNAHVILEQALSVLSKDISELSEGCKALKTIKDIKGKRDNLRDLEYATGSLRIIYDEMQLKAYKNSVERCIESYKTEAYRAVLAGRESKDPTVLKPGQLPTPYNTKPTPGTTGTEGFADLAASAANAVKKTANTVLDNMAARKFSFAMISSYGVDYKTTLADVKKYSKNTLEKLKDAKREIEKLANSDKAKNSSKAMQFLEIHIDDINILISQFEVGLKSMNQISPRDKSSLENIALASNATYVINADGYKSYLKLIERNLKGIKETLEQIAVPSVESFMEDNEFCLVNDEPSGLCVNATTFELENSDLGCECWGLQGGALNESNVNEISLPYKRTQMLLEERLAMATESIEERLRDINERLDDNFRNGDQSNGITQGAYRDIITVAGNSDNRLNRTFQGSNHKFDQPTLNQNKIETGKIDSNPTMINVRFYMHGQKASFDQQVVLGVKCMARMYNSTYVINDLVEGSKSSNPIFKFISWTRGEVNVVKDLIFNIGDVKKKFRDKRRNEYNLLDMSKDRKAIDNVTKFAANRLLPYTSLIVTDYEIAQAAQVTGVDLSNARNAKAFMDKYYLLAFGIYNSSTRKLSIMYDGDPDFVEMSMTYIQSEQKKSMDVSQSLSNLVSLR